MGVKVANRLHVGHNEGVVYVPHEGVVVGLIGRHERVRLNDDGWHTCLSKGFSESLLLDVGDVVGVIEMEPYDNHVESAGDL